MRSQHRLVGSREVVVLELLGLPEGLDDCNHGKEGNHARGGANSGSLSVECGLLSSCWSLAHEVELVVIELPVMKVPRAVLVPLEADTLVFADAPALAREHVYLPHAKKASGSLVPALHIDFVNGLPVVVLIVPLVIDGPARISPLLQIHAVPLPIVPLILAVFEECIGNVNAVIAWAFGFPGHIYISFVCFCFILKC